MQIIHKYKRITIIFTILFVILVAFPFATGASPADKHQKTRVAFRYDDYSIHNPTDLEIKLIDILQKYNIPCTFAIIPYVASKDTDEILPPEVEPLNEEKTYILKSAIASGIIEPALHGYSHEMVRGLKTEFSGLSYSDQMEKIIKFRVLLIL